MLGEELARVRVATADPLADELVEVADHLAVGGEVLRGHGLDGLGHPGHELIEDLALELLDELVERFAGARLHEVVVLQAADPLPEVRWQRVELVEPAGSGVAEHLAQVVRDIVAVRPRRLVQPALDPGPLLVDDLLELPADVSEHVVELVALEHGLALSLEPFHQVAKAGHVAAGRVARAPASVHQAAERFGEVALGHHVVGERVDDLVGVEVGDLLRAVPGGIARSSGEGVGGRPVRPWRHRRAEVARIGRVAVAGHRTAPVTGGRRSRPGPGPC